MFSTFFKWFAHTKARWWAGRWLQTARWQNSTACLTWTYPHAVGRTVDRTNVICDSSCTNSSRTYYSKKFHSLGATLMSCSNCKASSLGHWGPRRWSETQPSEVQFLFILKTTQSQKFTLSWCWYFSVYINVSNTICRHK